MKHIKYYCEYSYFDGRDALDESSKVIKAPSEREAYEIFIKDIGVHQSAVLVSWGLTGHETFYDHMSVEAASDDNESDVSNKLNMNSEQLLQKLINIQSEQTVLLNKIRWGLLGLSLFIVGQTIILKLNLGL